MSDRLTLATSTGLPFLALAFHFATGLIAMAVGFVAIAARKGGTWHRWSGLVFVYAMIATGLVAAGLALYEGKSTILGGLFTVYLVFTAYTTVRQLPGVGRRVDIALMVLAFSLAAVGYAHAFKALGKPASETGGVPVGMSLFMTTIVLLAAIGDARMIRAGGIRGTRRIARHLWRMSFGLFIASGSFLLGQMKFVPEPIRVVPVLVALAVSPLVLLLYWMWRIRVRQNLRGLRYQLPLPHPEAR